MRVSRAGGCGAHARLARRGARRRVRRRDVRGIPLSRQPFAGHDPAAGTRRQLRVDREPRLVRLQPERSQHRDGHHVLVVADGAASGVPEPAPGRMRAGAGGWGERVDPPEQVPWAEPGAVRLERGPLPQLRRGRRRLRAERGCGLRAAQAAGGGRGGWRPDPRCDPRKRDQPRRAYQRLHGAEPERAGGVDCRGLAGERRRRARDQLPGGARHGHGAGRPDRDRGAGEGLWGVGGRAG